MAQQGTRQGRHSRHSSKFNTGKTREGTGTINPAITSNSAADEETIAFIKRTLCAKPAISSSSPITLPDEVEDKPLDQLLPPLTSDNAVDIQLYAIIAVILNQYVQSWYHRISPDTDFVAEIVLIIAHCMRGVEERLRRVDLESLLLDELPAILASHLEAIEIAREACRARPGPHTGSDIASIYFTLRPRNALSPPPVDDATAAAESENEMDWSQLLVNHIMPLLLPPEDLMNPCLDVLVSEIFSEMIVHNAVLGKLTQPWLLWGGITSAIKSLQPTIQSRRVSVLSPTSRLDKYGLLSSAEKKHDPESNSAKRRTADIVISAFWGTLQYAMLAWTLLRTLAVALTHASSIPPRPRQADATHKVHTSDNVLTVVDEAAAQPSEADVPHSQPIVTMRIWSCADQILSLERRAPWLSGTVSLLQWLSLHGPGRICGANSALDRLMSAKIHEKLLDPALLPPVLHAIRSTAFPDNAVPPPRLPPERDEVIQIKDECARTVTELIPQPARTFFFATTEQDKMRDDVKETLDLFADAYLNKHLVVAALELIAVRLFPELGELESTA